MKKEEKIILFEKKRLEKLGIKMNGIFL